jgi:hypothetical protein
MTAEWRLSEMLISTAYGNLWLVASIGRNMNCLKMGKKKAMFYCTTKPKAFQIMEKVAVGDLLFEDKSGLVQHMKPEGEFAAQISKALERL